MNFWSSQKSRMSMFQWACDGPAPAGLRDVLPQWSIGKERANVMSAPGAVDKYLCG